MQANPTLVKSHPPSRNSKLLLRSQHLQAKEEEEEKQQLCSGAGVEKPIFGFADAEKLLVVLSTENVCVDWVLTSR